VAVTPSAARYKQVHRTADDCSPSLGSSEPGWLQVAKTECGHRRHAGSRLGEGQHERRNIDRSSLDRARVSDGLHPALLAARCTGAALQSQLTPIGWGSCSAPRPTSRWRKIGLADTVTSGVFPGQQPPGHSPGAVPTLSATNLGYYSVTVT
jgi:hypothetical protein